MSNKFYAGIFHVSKKLFEDVHVTDQFINKELDVFIRCCMNNYLNCNWGCDISPHEWTVNDIAVEENRGKVCAKYNYKGYSLKITTNLDASERKTYVSYIDEKGEYTEL